MNDTIAIVALWWVMSSLFVIMLSCCEVYPGKNKTWGELVLAILFCPGWITLIATITVSVAIMFAWDFLDRPIRKRKKND